MSGPRKVRRVASRGFAWAVAAMFAAGHAGATAPTSETHQDSIGDSNYFVGTSSSRPKRTCREDQGRVSTSSKIECVVDALRARDFKFVGRTFDGQLRFLGKLRCSESAHDCELQVDPQFIDIPSIQLLDLPSSLGPITPHINGNGQLCYIAKGTIVLDIFDPVGQTLACIQRAEEVFDSILKGDMVADLEEEFYAYWDGIPCLVDIQDQQLGRQNTMTVKSDGRLIVIVTDDALRTAAKLKSLNLDIADKKLLTYRIRTCAKPRPNLKADWPPKKICVKRL